MYWTYVNFITLGFMAVIMLPNIYYAAKCRDVENKCKNRIANIFEQIGRYSAFSLMILSFGKKFGFSSRNGFVIWLIISVSLIMAYLICWIFYFKNQTFNLSMALAILPAVLFTETGLMLKYWPLTAAAVIFAFSHIYVTYKNAKESK